MNYLKYCILVASDVVSAKMLWYTPLSKILFYVYEQIYSTIKIYGTNFHQEMMVRMNRQSPEP